MLPLWITSKTAAQPALSAADAEDIHACIIDRAGVAYTQQHKAMER
jgi:hypothetical protein